MSLYVNPNREKKTKTKQQKKEKTFLSMKKKSVKYQNWFLFNGSYNVSLVLLFSIFHFIS